MTNNDKVVQSIIKSLNKFILENPKKLGVQEKVTHLGLKLLGKGESNISLLAKVNKKHLLVFRIAQLYKDKVEKEYEILKKIPAGIGPEPIYLNTDNMVIPYPFLVESFISGKCIENWNQKNLSSLAKSLAFLHSKTKTKKEKDIKFTTKLKTDNNYFLKDKPELNTNEEVRTILKSVIRYLNTKEYFNELNCLSLIHGDLNKDNILIDKKNNIKFIDWELSHYNDAAREFSTFYYDDMKYLNWRIHLKSPLRETFLSKYKKEAKIQDDNFEERVKLWQIVDKAGAFIYCRWKTLVAEDNKEKAKFSKTASLLKSSLNKIIV